MRDGLRVIAGWITIILLLVGVFACSVRQENKAPAEAACYRQFASTYTWQWRLKELDEIWADKSLTNAECRKVQLIYEDAQKQIVVNETQEKIDRVRK